MGRKSRRGKHKNDTESDDSDNNNNNSNTPPEQSQSTTKSKYKELDYAKRQELKRQNAALKRKSKQKCFICGKTGHVRRECPGVNDDGRNMSRYKNKSDVKLEKKKYRARKYGEGLEEEEFEGVVKVVYPDGFQAVGSDGTESGDKNVYYYDAGCDISSTMEYLQHGRGKAKISHKEAVQEYRRYIQYAAQTSNLGALISKSVLKPNRPWINPSPFSSENSSEDSSQEENTTEIKVPMYFLVGLSSDTKLSPSNSQTIEQHLMETIEQNDEIIGLWSFLNYSPSYLSKHKNHDMENQCAILRLCCKVAAIKNVPIQVQLSPGITTATNEDKNGGGGGSVAGTPYAKTILDFQSILHTTLSSHPTLQIHLSCWSGRADHMTSLLQSFPSSNLYIGLDGHVSFSKAKYLHECAFDVPLDKLVLETAEVIPSKVANFMGRDAFYYSGWLPFVAEAVAKCKKVVSGVEVARKAAENTVRIYPVLDRRKKEKEGMEENDDDDDDDHHHDGKDGSEDNDDSQE